MKRHKTVTILSRIWAELREPDAFPRDWYGWSTGQMGHFVIGLSTAAALSYAHLRVFGEFQDKLALWLTIAAIYVIWETVVQPWRGFDSVEDWWFFVVYGAGMAIFLFDEVNAGEPDLWTSMEYIPPFMAIFWGHILAGVVVRVWRKAG